MCAALLLCGLADVAICADSDVTVYGAENVVYKVRATHTFTNLRLWPVPLLFDALVVSFLR